MVWIFDQCNDPFGQCIRQYIDAGINFIISILGIWFCIKTYKKQRQLTFQMIPLAINFIITLFIFFLQISTEQFFNTHLIFMFVEIYTYFLLTYALVFLYLRADKLIQAKSIKKLNIGFIIGSIFIVLFAILVTILSFSETIVCNSIFWISTLVLLLLQLPIYLITIRYSAKTKQKIKQLSSKYQKAGQSSFHLIKQEDSYIKLKILQTNMFLITFSLSILIHISQIVIYQFMENDSICLPQTNIIRVRNLMQLILMSIQNLSQITPHLMIPLIFWIIPQNINKKAPASLYIIPKLASKIDSVFRIDAEEEDIHKKFINH